MAKDLTDDYVTSAEPDLAAPMEAALLEDPLLIRITSQAPWWLVSVVFHILIVVLAYMCTLAISVPEEETVVVSPPPSRMPLDQLPVDLPKPVSAANTLSSLKDIKATDPDAKVLSKIEIPEYIRKIAELGDQFQTINMEMPDTQGANGNPDAGSFRHVAGNAEAVGGNDHHSSNQLEEMISSGTDPNRPRESRWNNGAGFGGGVDKGDGHASFGAKGRAGRRLVITRTPEGRRTESAVEPALRWLAYHQESDGHWDAKKFGASEKTDTAVTSLALLAFLGAGNSEKVGPEYKSNVQKAVAWLKSKQAPNGLVFDTTDAGGHRGEGYPGAMATMALAEAAAMANVPETRTAAQRAVTYCTNIHQAGEGSDRLGWRYHPKMEGDTSVTGWFMMALKSAKIARLDVDHAAFDGAIKFLDSVEHKATGGDPGYASPSTYWYTVKDAHEPHRLTAIGCLCRQYLGWKKEDLQASVDGFVEKGGVPSWGGNGGNVDLYYWYYGSLCTFQQQGDTWKKVE